MRKEIIVCDVCEDPTVPAVTYTVSASDRTGVTDRCAIHSEELEAILTRVFTFSDELEAILSPDQPRPRRRPGRPGMQVVSMEEVERAKGQK
ncbi:hypothetical protein [Micromonospora coerulea]|uniref:hypothetical protein n=1 Tax=Micromonospora coerulea TaxID=47856 RepID=UPI0019063A04|nr:hypothetical protein [Micromonospora veneta]